MVCDDEYESEQNRYGFLTLLWYLEPENEFVIECWVSHKKYVPIIVLDKVYMYNYEYFQNIY